MEALLACFGVCLPPSDRSEFWERVDCWEVSSCMGTPSGPVGALLLLADGEGADELGVEFAERATSSK